MTAAADAQLVEDILAGGQRLEKRIEGICIWTENYGIRSGLLSVAEGEARKMQKIYFRMVFACC